MIGPDVVIGPRTTIGAHAVIEGPTRIGADNQIFQFASIGAAPQDKKYRGEPTQLTIGDRNVFREFCTMNRGTASGRGLTSIGSDSLFMAYTHVAHDCDIGDKVILANCATMGGHVQIGDWVQLGGLSAIHQFCKIGAHAFVAGGAVLTRDLPPLRDDCRQPRAADLDQFRRPQAARLYPRADPQSAQRLSHPVPLGSEARGCGPEAH